MTKTTTGTRSGDSKLHISSNCETLAFTGTTQGETKTSLALKGLRKEAKTGGGRFSSPNEYNWSFIKVTFFNNQEEITLLSK
jgi:hypothetical protein